MVHWRHTKLWLVIASVCHHLIVDGIKNTLKLFFLDVTLHHLHSPEHNLPIWKHLLTDFQKESQRHFSKHIWVSDLVHCMFCPSRTCIQPEHNVQDKEKKTCLFHHTNLIGWHGGKNKSFCYCKIHIHLSSTHFLIFSYINTI